MFKYIMMFVVLCLMSLTSCTSRGLSINESSTNNDGSSCICVSSKGNVSLRYISGFSSGSSLDE